MMGKGVPKAWEKAWTQGSREHTLGSWTLKPVVKLSEVKVKWVIRKWTDRSRWGQKLGGDVHPQSHMWGDREDPLIPRPYWVTHFLASLESFGFWGRLEPMTHLANVGRVPQDTWPSRLLVLSISFFSLSHLSNISLLMGFISFKCCIPLVRSPGSTMFLKLLHLLGRLCL